MRISPIINTYNSKKPAFRSMACDYKLPNKKEMGLYTWMFRDDLDWQKFAKFSAENFKTQSHVNIIQFAPSDGSEGYTAILSLLKYAPDEAEKFFPIQAYDINKSVIRGANSGYLNLNVGDVERLIDNGINANKYFPDSLPFYLDKKNNQQVIFKTFKVNKELTKRINFNYGDMFEKLPQIQDNSNTILLVRNSLGYYDCATQQDFIKQVANVLKHGSLFVTGLLEETQNITLMLEMNGFRKIMRNVFKKCAY